MNKNVIVGAAIIAGALLFAAAAVIYFSPTQSCIRERLRVGADPDAARFMCSTNFQPQSSN